MNLKNGKVFTSKFVGNGPSSYEKRIYRAAVSQNLRNTARHYSVLCTGWRKIPWRNRLHGKHRVPRNICTTLYICAVNAFN